MKWRKVGTGGANGLYQKNELHAVVEQKQREAATSA
jgi:hypothetical protein